MSDAISDVEKENADYKRSQINVNEAAKMLRALRGHVCDYEDLKMNLTKLGYVVEENGRKLKIWKQI